VHDIVRPLHLSRPEYWCYLVVMPSSPVPLTLAPTLPFKYVGGDPSIDLVNTVDWTPRGLVDERLTDYDRLTRWAEGAGQLNGRQGSRLRARAAEHPRLAERAYRDALALRWQLRQLFVAIAHDRPVSASPALAELNAALSSALGQLELAPRASGGDEGGVLQWSWRDANEQLDHVLWPVLWAAGELLASDEATRIRECGGEDCGWLYVDRSRNGLRRWCQMEVCGTKEKSRQRALRRAEGQ
jgi:predicted RNA-binding Zn ribbon-like protein